MVVALQGVSLPMSTLWAGDSLVNCRTYIFARSPFLGAILANHSITICKAVPIEDGKNDTYSNLGEFVGPEEYFRLEGQRVEPTREDSNTF